MLIFLFAIAAIVWRKDGSIYYSLVPVAIFIGVYWLVAINSNINIGHRHILVTYPAFFIISGAVSLWRSRFKTLCMVLCLAAFIVYIPETTVIWPDYLAFFNVASGGPQHGYRLLVDSSLDWGQDLPALKQWLLESNLDTDQTRMPVYLSYFGTASPKYYNINTLMIMSRYYPWNRDIHMEATRFIPGVYCISATSLQQVYEVFGGWTKDREQQYWQLMEVNRQYETARKTPETWADLQQKYGGAGQIAKLLRTFRRYQFARLCHHLKQRDPDHQIGHSILIYFVGHKELRNALSITKS